MKKLLLVSIISLIIPVLLITVYADSFARPDGSPSTRWVNGIGGGTCTDLLTHNCVNEVTRNDATFIQTTALGNGGSDSQFFTLSNIADPLQSTGHILRYTLREGNQGTNPVGFTIILRQGSTVIATFTHAQGTLPTTFTLFQQTLTNIQADSITDYNNLELTLIGSCTTGCANQPAARERVAVSWVEFAIVTQIQPPVLNSVQVVSSNALQLFWTEPLSTTGILSYNIERSSGGSPFSVVGNVPVATTQFLDGGLIPNTAYTYRLVSVGSTGNSIPSNQITQTTTVFVIPSDFSRPDSSTGLRWVDGIGTNCTALNNYLCVDEAIRDDLDYIQTINLGNGGSDTQLFTMTNILDPQKSNGHVLRYTLREAGLGTNQPSFTITLRQGPAVIGTWNHPQGSLPSTFTVFEQTLTQVQTDSITDYLGLELTLLAQCLVNCGNNPADRDKVQVSWIEFEIIPFVPTPTLSSNFIGRAIQVTWFLPSQSVSNNDIYKWTLKKQTNAGSFADIMIGTRDPNNKPLENGFEVRSIIDQSVLAGSTYTYQLLYESFNGRNSTLTDLTTPIQIPNEFGFTFKAQGKLLQTTRVLTPRTGGIIQTSYFPDFKQQEVYAETAGLQPIITSPLNPKDLPYLVSLTPIPSPLSGTDCKQALEIIYSRDGSDGGQNLVVTATILENQNTVRNQHLYDQNEISDVSHIFNYWWVIPLPEQAIQDFTNLEVQLDIDSSNTLNPSEYRTLSIYQVNFYVPESNQVC